ncbi:MAG: hypothetical protein HYY04_01530 [Chloroflexi bacterium]|nr:hypothetical protein [Chloroflexota bacterium]
MITGQAKGHSQREQINLVLQSDAPLARRLREAEIATGQPRTQIVREIVQAFLDAWLRAELTKRSLLEAASAGVSPAVTPVRSVTRLVPRQRRGYRPEPGLAEAVAARRPFSPHPAGEAMTADSRERVRYGPRARPSAPVRDSLDSEA